MLTDEQIRELREYVGPGMSAVSELCTRVLEAEANLRASETRESEKVEALQARIKALEKALQPFGKAADKMDAYDKETLLDGRTLGFGVTFGDVYRARKALEEGK